MVRALQTQALAVVLQRAGIRAEDLHLRRDAVFGAEIGGLDSDDEHHGSGWKRDAGWQMMQTGRRFTGGIATPHAGSVVSYLQGRKSDLPPFVVLPQLMGRGGGNLPNGQAGVCRLMTSR